MSVGSNDPREISSPESRNVTPVATNTRQDPPMVENLTRLDASKFFQDREQHNSVEQYIPHSGPLLGSEEMEKYLGGRKAIIQVTTWNSGSLPIPKEFQLRKLFFHEEDDLLKKVDIHVVCIQECWPDSDAWELAIQSVLGIGFALFDSLAFGTLHISVFMRRDLLWFTGGIILTLFLINS